jgi:ectoine hydroxylase-related dioxygenase (phytanoyl-CoA dioxygenase family)
LEAERQMKAEQDVKAYGVREVNELTSELDRHVEEITVRGFTVVEGVIADSELEEARARTDRVYETQVAEVGGAENLGRIDDELVTRCLLAYDEYFLAMALRPKVISVVERLLGDYFTLLQQNAITNLPGRDHYQTSWHRDLPYQHFVASRPLAVSALFCLDDFSAQTGGTHVLPASHKVERFPSREYVTRHEEAVNATAGSALVFDSMLFHRGGVNASDGPRRGLNHLYGLPFVKQQIDLPRALGGRYSEDEFLARFLGYESAAAESVVAWRTKRLERLKES